MKLIVAGCRDFDDISFVHQAIHESGFSLEVTEVVSGGAAGVDYCGEAIARDCAVPVKVFKADWNQYGKSAGPIRNKQMAEYADTLVAVWDGKSPGTKNMIDHMRRLKKPVFIKLFKRDGSPKDAA